MFFKENQNVVFFSKVRISSYVEHDSFKKNLLHYSYKTTNPQTTFVIRTRFVINLFNQK